jgi:uncharacterized membrane protein
MKSLKHKPKEQIWVSLLVVLPVLILVSASLTQEFIPESYQRFNKFWLSKLCHSQADRSFSIFNEPMLICARCTGIYSSLAVGILLTFFISFSKNLRKVAALLLISSSTVILVDVVGDYLLWWENTLLSRFITGGFLGLSLSSFFITKSQN